MRRVRSMSQTMARIMRVSAGLLLLSVTFSIGGAAQQSVPALVQFSGQLKDQDSKPLSGVQGVTFALYKDRSGGASLWMETQNVTADSEGRFVALLGQALRRDCRLICSAQARRNGWACRQQVMRNSHARS